MGMVQEQYIEVSYHGSDKFHEILHWMGEAFGYHWIICFAAIGLVVLFRNRIKQWFMK